MAVSKTSSHLRRFLFKIRLPPTLRRICYPISSGVDYDRPQHTSYSQTSSVYGSAYDRPEEGETYSQPKPDYGFRPGAGYGHGGAEVSHESRYGSGYGGGEGESYSSPQPGYGFSSGMNRPGFGEEAPHPVSEYGSGYGGGEESYSRPAADYDFRPGLNRPGYGGGARRKGTAAAAGRSMEGRSMRGRVMAAMRNSFRLRMGEAAMEMGKRRRLGVSRVEAEQGGGASASVVWKLR